MNSDETTVCDRKRCDRSPQYELTTESPILHEDPTMWHLCEEHVHTAIEEFRGTSNILSSKEIAGGDGEPRVFRVKSVNLRGNTKATTWVRAPTRWDAGNYVREVYSSQLIESCLERTPPEDVEIEDAAGVKA
jgi:hypothetical protein